MQKNIASSNYLGIAKTITIIILAGLFLLLGASAYFIYGENKISNLTPTPTQQLNISPSIQQSALLTYSNPRQNLEFKYPRDWVVRITAEEDNYISGIISSPNNVSVAFLVGPPGVGGRCDVNPNTDQGHELINSFNTDLTLHYYGDKSTDTISYAYVIKSRTQCPNIAFFSIPDTFTAPNGTAVQKLASIKIAHSTSSIPSSEFKSKELETAKEIISSFNVISSQ